MTYLTERQAMRLAERLADLPQLWLRWPELGMGIRPQRGTLGQTAGHAGPALGDTHTPARHTERHTAEEAR